MDNLQMIATIQCYIHHRTGREVNINQPRTHEQFFLLVKAYESCKGFFINK
jgi:uncharacterized Fe-S cluster-containing radical SAM superfamily enzyme